MDFSFAFGTIASMKNQTLNGQLCRTIFSGESAKATKWTGSSPLHAGGHDRRRHRMRGKAGDQALRRSAFQEAISHLGKAIEMADKAEEGAPRAAPTPAAAEQRLKLQTVYANALIHAAGMVLQKRVRPSRRRRRSPPASAKQPIASPPTTADGSAA